MGFDRDFRRRADAVRAIDLEIVLQRLGAIRDRRDKSKWRLGQESISITRGKFMNWQRHAGGGGAIDLVMQLRDMDVRAAVAWLEQQFSAGTASALPTPTYPPAPSRPALEPKRLRLPVPQAEKLEQVRRYLIHQRRLAVSLVESLIEAGKLYADHRANAVFLMVAGKPNRPVGAELRGTGPRVWRGHASGTCKDQGYFWIGKQGASKLILCEAAIDAISCFQLFGDCICISTAGVRSNPAWLTPLLSRGYEIHCGFDADGPGDTAAREMIARYPRIHRLRPSAHDWNDALASSD